jgi:hypothetical protein
VKTEKQLMNDVIFDEPENIFIGRNGIIDRVQLDFYVLVCPFFKILVQKIRFADTEHSGENNPAAKRRFQIIVEILFRLGDVNCKFIGIHIGALGFL